MEQMKKKIKGTVVLMKKNVLDLNDFGASFLDRVYELFGKRISIKLISKDYFEDSCQFISITMFSDNRT